MVLCMAISPQYFLTDGGDAQGVALLKPAETPATFIHNVISTTGFTQLINIQSSSSPETKFTIFGGNPSFRRQSQQGAPKHVTKGESSKLTINADTYAAITLYSDQGIRDVILDPRLILSDKLRTEMIVQMEAETLGIYRKDDTWASGFTTPLKTLDNEHTTEWDPSTGLLGYADALAVAVAEVESRDYIPNGGLVGRGLINKLLTTRNVTTLKDDAGDVTGFHEASTNLYNSLDQLNPDLSSGIHPTINLVDPFTASDGDVIGVIGNWQLYAIRILEQLSSRLSTDATIVDSDGNEAHLFQDDGVALKTEFSMAGGCVDNDAFQLIVKQSGS